MSNGVKLEGFEQFKKKLNDVPKNVQRTSLGIVTDLSIKWKGLAINSAPVDQSALRRGISSKVVSKSGNIISAEVYSNAAHSRFVEWGTKGKKVVPGELAAYESSLEYKKTGDYYDFLQSILFWVKRKGIGVTYQTGVVKSKFGYSYNEKRYMKKTRMSKDQFLGIAEAIAWSIMKKGINPQPFFFIHKAGIEQELKVRLKEVLG